MVNHMSVPMRAAVSGFVAAALCALGTPLPTHAAETPLSMDGWTETRFVDAAAANGVPRSVAEDAWGDRNAMRPIPVASGTGSDTHWSNSSITKSRSVLAPDSSANVAAVTGSAWASCLRYTKNWLGTVIKQLRVQTNYTYSGANITSWNTRVYPTTGIGWAFAGIVASNDYYSAVGSSPRAHHSSYRMGKFDADVGGATNMWVRTTVYAPAGYACASGGE